MKKRFLWMLAAILICGTSTLLTSCSDNEDNPVEPSKQIVGKWYAENNTPGSINADGISIDYQKLVQYADFKDNGTGFWSIIFVDEDGHAIDIAGYFCGGMFNYTVKGNTVTITMTSAGLPILKDSWDVTFAENRLYVTTSEINHTMEPVTNVQNSSVQKWLRELGLGGSPEVDLASLESDCFAQDGDILTGTLNSKYKISIADGATVTLDGVTVNCNDACIRCEGSATIVLADGSKNTLTGSSYAYPALMAGPEGTTLTIQGSTGILNVKSKGGCAGIGGGRYLYGETTHYYSVCGNIVIEGGVIDAQGGEYSPGIGSDYYGWCGNIIISGGTVTATGGEQAPGIGAGVDATCGDINIKLGVHSVTATKGRETNERTPIGKGRGNSHCSHVIFGRTQVGYDSNDWEKKLKDGKNYGGLMLIFSNFKDGISYTWTLRPEFYEGNYYALTSPNTAFEGEGYEKIFDGKKETKWCCSKKNNEWSVEFMSKKPITPTMYTLTTANDSKEFSGRNPKKWKLYGKLNDGDNWTLLDSQDDGALPADNYQKKSFSCREMKCQYFNFVICEIVSGDLMQLAEFEFDQK